MVTLKIKNGNIPPKIYKLPECLAPLMQLDADKYAEITNHTEYMEICAELKKHENYLTLMGYGFKTRWDENGPGYIYVAIDESLLEKLTDFIRSRAGFCSKSDITRKFQSYGAAEVNQALNDLEAKGRIAVKEMASTGGRRKKFYQKS